MRTERTQLLKEQRHELSIRLVPRSEQRTRDAVAVLSKVSPTGWLLFAGSAVAAFGTLLPWEQDTTPFGTQLTAGPSSVPGGVAMLMALVATVVCIGWPAGPVPRSRRRVASV